MASCEVCGESGAGRVVLGNRETGAKTEAALCPRCAAKLAVGVAAAGGRVVFSDGGGSSSGTASRGNGGVWRGVLAVAGVAALVAGAYFLFS